MEKDWKALRDELVAKDLEEKQAAWDEWCQTMGIPRQTVESTYSKAQSEEDLARLMEIHYKHLLYKGYLTKDTVERYSDFFDRTGLPTDLDGYMAELDAEWKRKEDYGERVAPVSAEEERKTMCREYRRSIGEQLKAMREKRGYSLRYVEEQTGISKNIISRTEYGRANTTIDTLSILSDFYGIGIEVSRYADLTRIDKA